MERDSVLVETSSRCPPCPLELVPAIPGFDVVIRDTASPPDLWCPSQGLFRPHPVLVGQ